MERNYPEKDVKVAARLIEKLSAAQIALANTQSEYDEASEEYESHRTTTDVRGSYIDVLKEIASELGEEVDDHDAAQVEALAEKVAKLSESLAGKTAEVERLFALAEKLKASSPDLYEYASGQISSPASSKKTKKENDSANSTEKTEPAQASTRVFEAPPIDKDPSKLRNVFELAALKQNPQLRRRGKVEPTIVCDAYNMIQLIGRYKAASMSGIDYARNLMISDLDFLSGEIQLPITVVFDTDFQPGTEIDNRVSLLSVSSRTSPDKAASDRQILRFIEEAQLERKPVLLVTNNVPLSREAATLGAINLTLQEVFTEA